MLSLGGNQAHMWVLLWSVSLLTSSQISETNMIWQVSDLHRTLEILFQMSKQNHKDPRGWSADFSSLQQTQIILKGHLRCKH